MRAEFERQRRVVDQMITAHSALRDKYRRLGLLQDVLLLVLSTSLTATALMDPNLWPKLNLTVEGGRLVRGIASILVFASTVVSLRVRWKERGASHESAVNALAELKSVARLIDPDASPDAARDWLEQAIGAFKGLPEVPESAFLRLKARHLRKIALSKLLDRHPGALVTFVRVRIVLTESFKSLRNRASDE